MPGMELLVVDWLHPVVHWPETKSGAVQSIIKKIERKPRHKMLLNVDFVQLDLLKCIIYRCACFVLYGLNAFFIVTWIVRHYLQIG